MTISVQGGAISLNGDRLRGVDQINEEVRTGIFIYPPKADLVQPAFAADGGACGHEPPRLKHER
jgi:hypothetical protein